MLIDCDTCVARTIACDDCVISVLLATPAPVGRPDARPDGRPALRADLDDADRTALGNLANAGLVPPLRLVAAPPALAPGSTVDPEINCGGPPMSGNDREIAV